MGNYSLNRLSFDTNNYIFTLPFGTCSTAAGTIAKAVTLDTEAFSLESGAMIVVKFTVTNTASNPTLNVNGTGAMPIKYKGSNLNSNKDILTINKLYHFNYNGTDWEIIGSYDAPIGVAPITVTRDSGDIELGIDYSDRLSLSNNKLHIPLLEGATTNIQTQLDGKQNTINGGASTITSSNLTTNRALISNSSGKVAVSAITSTELGYLDGVTSNIQEQFDDKEPIISLTANRALISNSSGKVAVSAVTSTELGYLDGVTSNIQTQLNGKLSTTGTAAKATADASGNEITRFYESLMPIGATTIPANADLNSIEYLRVGTYLCAQNTTVATLANCPTSSAFIMKVRSPITASIDNESTSTYRQRIREILTYQGAEFIQYVMNSSSVAGEWEYQGWGKKYTSGNLNSAPEIIELQEDINNLTTLTNNQITYGSGNGWSWTIFPDNSIIMRSVATVHPSTTTSSSSLYYTDSIPVYFPSGIKVYDGVFTGTTKGSRCWLINSGVYEAGNGVYFRIMTNYSTINQEAVTVNCFVYGSLVPVTYPSTPSVETTGTAIADFKIWTNPSRNMKVTYTATRTSNTAATVKLTYTYTMNGSSGWTTYAQSVTPTINGSAKSTTTLKSTSDDDSWYGSPIVKTVSYSITGLSASTTSISLSCKFTSTDSDDSTVTKTGTINLGSYS